MGLAKGREETFSTISIGTLRDEEVEALEDGSFQIRCNVCNKCATSETDMSQTLACGHIHLEHKDSKDKTKHKSVFEEMIFRMKALKQGNDNGENKKLVDNFYERNDKFMLLYPMYGRYKTGLQNLALLKKTEKKSGKSKWSRVRNKIKSLTWIYKNVNSQHYTNF